MSSIVVVPSMFKGGGRPGDFGWMIGRPEYDDAFFVFNDNEHQFLRHLNDPTDPEGCAVGGGNAAIRPWQCVTPPRSGGIPTGGRSSHAGGSSYTSLTAEVEVVLDQAIAAIKTVVTANGFARVFYSSDGRGGLGTGIFHVAGDVKEYIVRGIETLAD